MFICNVSRPRYESLSSDGDDGQLITTITAEDLEINVHPQTPAKNFFFYQGELYILYCFRRFIDVLKHL